MDLRIPCVTAALTLSTLLGASSASAAPVKGSRSFMVDLHPGNMTSVREIELVATADTAHPDAPTKLELRVGAVDKAPDQILSFTVEAGAEAALASADVVDVNFDGYRDFWVLREMGAKWGRYDVFVYEPKSGKFIQDALSREVATLDNPEIDGASKVIVSSSIGPSEPYRAVRKVQGGHLVMTESCVFHNGQDTNHDDKNEGTLVIQKLVQGILKIVTQKAIAVGPQENPCSLGAPTP
jgi:hypothetical protein